MLKVEPHEPKPLKWWYRNRNRLDFEATYQRHGGVWRTKTKAYLVDSILNGYDVPKLYLADFRRSGTPLRHPGSKASAKMYAVIDGKQRFEAVFDFFGDRFPLSRDFAYEPDPSLKLSGLRYSELVLRHPSIAETFDNYQFAVMSVITDDPGKIMGLFVRLNQGKALTGAEVRNAMLGVVPVLVRELVQLPFFVSQIRFGTKRQEDHNAATKVLLVEYKGQLVSTKKDDLDHFAQSAWLGEQDEPPPEYLEAYDRARKILGAMADVFEDRDPLLRGAGMVPIYYWLVRNHRRKRGSAIRPFLESFETERKANTARAEAGETPVNQTLLAFSKRRRSPNDSGAMEWMYACLEEGLIKYAG